jgi:hypothetical protein
MWVQIEGEEFGLVLAKDIVGKDVVYQKNAVWDVDGGEIEFVPGEEKLPEWVWSLSSGQCQKLICNIIFGKDEFVNEFKTCCYFTSCEEFGNDMMRLCLHAGWIGEVVQLGMFMWKIRIVKDVGEVNFDNQVEELVSYTGGVFCLQVPSEVFYVRRNGKGVWTGNSRCRGPQTQLTRQPPEGRSQNGGLRSGEMERDALIAHGLAKFLKERLLETSDLYHCYICNKCGLFAQRMLRKDMIDKPTKKDVYFCPSCKNYTDISKIRIPYAFKLLIQELLSINICPRINVKKDPNDY